MHKLERRDWGAWAASLAVYALVIGFAAGFALGFVADYRRAFFGMASSDDVAMADAPKHDPCADDVWHVLPGDTLWSIASRCYPGEHTGQMVAAIREANPNIDPGRMRYGDVLALPERSK